MNTRDEHLQKIKQFAEEFKSAQKNPLVLSDENRQYLILEMMPMGECGGVRVGEITVTTYRQYRILCRCSKRRAL